MGAGGATLAVAGGAGAAGAEGWRAPPGVACTLARVVGDFCEPSGVGLTRGAGASCEKFGRAGGGVAAGPVGLAWAAAEGGGGVGDEAPPGAGGVARPAGGAAGVEIGARAVGAVAAGRGRTGGDITTAA